MTIRRAEILLAAVICARATSFMFSKVLVGTLEPFNVLAVRFLVASLLLAILFWKRFRGIGTSTVARGGAIGIAFFITMALEMYAMTGASSSTVSFLENMAIVLVPLATALLLRKLPPATVICSCVVAMAGVGLLTLGGASGLDTVPGILLGLGSGAGYTAAIMVTARLSREDDPLVLGVIQVATMGALSFLAMLFFESPALPATPLEWGSIAVLVVVCTGFGFTLQPVAQRYLSADRVGLFCALSPLVAAVLGVAFLAEPLTPLRLAGMALIAASMFVANRPAKCSRGLLGGNERKDGAEMAPSPGRAS